MARRLRIQYPDARYHVINRGNYRRDLFESAGAASAFVRVLTEATALHGWRVHAYVIMRNHFHLAVETPQPNLVEGMHWLQSTLATRFNRFRHENGHLFQGRYQSLLIEDTAALSRVVDYIHLNPVRAGIVAAAQATAFRWSSLGRFVRNTIFPGLTAEDWLAFRGLSPTAAGWRDYTDHLAGLAEDQTQQKRLGFESLSRGWAIGTEGWRRALAKEFSHQALSPGLAAAEIRSLREAAWDEALREILRQAGRTPEELQAAGKTAAWKVELALRVRQRCGASVVWLAQSMNLGRPEAARCQLSLARRRQSDPS